jgi:asparaginyl-tRNA synthetase
MQKRLCSVQVELKADEVQLIGGCDAEKYPLQKKRHTLEFLRGIAHLRPRTNTVNSRTPTCMCLT